MRTETTVHGQIWYFEVHDETGAIGGCSGGTNEYRAKTRRSSTASCACVS